MNKKRLEEIKIFFRKYAQKEHYGMLKELFDYIQLLETKCDFKQKEQRPQASLFGTKHTQYEMALARCYEKHGKSLIFENLAKKLFMKIDVAEDVAQKTIIKMKQIQVLGK